MLILIDVLHWFLINMFLRVGFSRCIPALVHWCGFNAHFKSENSEIWRECTDIVPALNFVLFKKIAQGDLSLGKIFTKNSKFSRFLAA